jgi:regulator of sigma E protease
VKVSSTEDAAGNLLARVIEAPAKKLIKEQSSLQELANDELLRHEGKVRGVEGDTLLLADMIYSLNYTPLGGFVRLAGESNPAVPRSLASKGTGPRAIVLAAGAFMNAIFPLLALVVLAIIFMLPHQVATGGDVSVAQVVPGSPAEAAGLQVNDIISMANGQQLENVTELTRISEESNGAVIELVVDRGGQPQVIRVAPRLSEPENKYRMGIAAGLINIREETRRENPVAAVGLASSTIWSMLGLLGQAVAGWFSGGEGVQLSGPIAIAQYTSEVTQIAGLTGWILLASVFSINLAVLNIMPIPMLDGGRLVFVIIEWARRGKRVPPEKESMVHLAGFVVLIGLILWISYKDVLRLLSGESPLGG